MKKKIIQFLYNFCTIPYRNHAIFAIFRTKTNHHTIFVNFQKTCDFCANFVNHLFMKKRTSKICMIFPKKDKLNFAKKCKLKKTDI